MALMFHFPHPSQRCIRDVCNYNGTKYKITTYSVLMSRKHMININNFALIYWYLRIYGLPTAAELFDRVPRCVDL
jgi:hypothetical protein